MIALRNTLFLLLVLLTGCAELGITQPQSFEDKLAYAYGTHTAVLRAAATSLDAKDISSADATQVLKLADESRLLLNAARTAQVSGDITTANGKLVLATSILTQLQSYLRSKT